MVTSPSGLKELEPYQVKQAIIMAAGFGSRMLPTTKDTPKPLVEVNGRRIIETLLDALVAAEIKDITVIVGYQ
ncbi:sugar phosphate nucleotidyltransferase [Ligilactobacillus agilis]|uniref:sugar phosphate nucleotidyltransferase n=1 Tax=Ligilactobacillus agilis TaxID=1601 RepID=UPI001D366868|nr:sugar phosphate nucleotidyltransferase [Ligilactobacillus agilis]HJG06180.1 NTP transferase domain-containing protein [Ligilactobacillus agilis]